MFWLYGWFVCARGDDIEAHQVVLVIQLLHCQSFCLTPVQIPQLGHTVMVSQHGNGGHNHVHV